MAIMNTPKLVSIDSTRRRYSTQIQLQWDNSMTVSVIRVPGMYQGDGIDDVFNPISLGSLVHTLAFVDANYTIDFDPFNAGVAGKSTCGRFFIWTEDSAKVWGFGAFNGSNNVAGVPIKSNIQHGTIPLNSFASSPIHFSKIIDNDDLCSGQAVIVLNTFISRLTGDSSLTSYSVKTASS